MRFRRSIRGLVSQCTAGGITDCSCWWEFKESSIIIYAVKVWTKLRNGLFGWRSKCKAKRPTGGVEQVTPLTLAENLGIDKNGGTQLQTERKLDSGGVLRERESKDEDCDLERMDYDDRITAAKKLKTI